MTETPRVYENGQGAAGNDVVAIEGATDEVLRIQLEKFEGPFELLLYLIKTQEIDIFDIPIVKITEQYLRFLDLMRGENLDVTGEFLVMAATLIQIKSRMLLPDDVYDEEEEIEEDPRLELVQKLLEYRRYRDIAAAFQELEAKREHWFARNVAVDLQPEKDAEEYLEVDLYDLIEAFRGFLRFFSDDLFHTVRLEGVSVDEKVGLIEDLLAEQGSIAWTDLFKECRSRIEVVCYFLAILELCRMGKVRVHQHGLFDEIRLFPVADQTAVV
jgi:segregation and condensation protein A